MRFISIYASGCMLASLFALAGCDQRPSAMQVERVAESSPATADNSAANQQSVTEPGGTSIKPAAKPARISDEAFRLAAYEGRLETVRSALDAGSDINAADPQTLLTPLHMAAYNGHTNVVRVLLERGAAVDPRDHEGKTPLIHACTGPFVATVEVLISAGADVNARDATEAFTPLMMAAGLGQPDVVKILLESKADPDLLDDDGETALDHARNSGHAAVTQLLRQAPASQP